MTKQEFSRAFDIAADTNIDLSDVSYDHLHGCGLPDFQRTTTTIMPVARLIRWQCLYIGHSIGAPPSWDEEALGELKQIARLKFDLVGT